MSVKVMSWVFENCHPGIPSKKLVMLALADFADANGVCWPSNGKIAENTSIGDVRHVRRLIKELEESGHIMRFDQYKDNRQRSSLTIVMMDRTPEHVRNMISADYDFYIPHSRGEGLQAHAGGL